MKFKKLLSLGLAFVLSLSFVFFLPLKNVSALDTAWLTPSDSFVKGASVSNSSFNIALSSLQSLFDRNNINYNSYYIVISDYSVSTDRHIFMFPKGNESLSNYNFTSSYDGSSYNIYTGDNIYIIADDFSGVSLFANSYQSIKYGLCANSSGYGYFGCQFQNKSLTSVFTSSSFIYFSSLNISLLPEDAPEVLPSDLEGYNLHFSYDVDSFYDWIINNNKLSELPSYIVQSKLKSFLSFYKSYGSSSTNFFQKISDWFSFMSIPNQTFDNTAILKGSIDKLYQEYLRYRSSQHAYWPGATITQNRDNISTNTDNNNTTLITDDVNDDLITKLFRDILRGVIAISNQVYESGNSIIGALDELSFDVVVSNNGGYSGTDINPLLQKMDDIIEALQADTVSVEIDQTTQDDTDQFLSDWADDFSVELDSKFPVINQLGTLFSDDFFEKCGIDTDGDGEVFEYYNPEVALSRSAPASSESDIVSDFLSQFDDSDPAFLDNVSFSESVPDWSVSIAGTKVSVFSFKLYAKYRTWIHTIISFIIWTCFLLGLYKSLPGLIGNVANTFDVSHDIFDDKTASK